MFLLDVIESLLNQYPKDIKYIVRKFKPNQIVLKQGKDHANLYVITKGEVRIAIRNEENTSISIHPAVVALGPGDIFGEFGLFEDIPASADVVSVQECELIEIDIASLRLFLEEHPKAGYNLLACLFTILVSRLRKADKTIISLYQWGLKAHQFDKLLE